MEFLSGPYRYIIVQSYWILSKALSSVEDNNSLGGKKEQPWAYYWILIEIDWQYSELLGAWQTTEFKLT